MDNSLLEEFLVPPSFEQEYCRKGGFFLTRLKKGPVIIGFAREMIDSCKASVNFHFLNGGSYFDPPGKEGIHHLIEHLINPPLWPSLEQLDVSLQAQTNINSLQEIIIGPFSPVERRYGLAYALPLVVRRIESLIAQKEITGLLSQEKKVLLAELREKQADFQENLFKAVYQICLTKDNPINSPGETEATLKSLDEKTVSTFLPEVFSKEAMIVSFLFDGKRSEMFSLGEDLIQIFRAWPQGAPRRTFPWRKLNRIKDNFKRRNIFWKNKRIVSGTCAVLLCWPIKFSPFTARGLALRRLVEFLQGRFQASVRRLGVVYSTIFRLWPIGSNTVIFAFGGIVRDQTWLKMKKVIIPFLKELRSDLFEIGKEEKEEIIELERRRQKVLPITQTSRLNWSVFGLMEFGQLVDAEAIKKKFSQIGVNDVSFWSNYFLTHPERVLVFGDWKKEAL